MNKNQLINAVAEQSGMTKLAASNFIDAFVFVVQDELRSEGGEIRLTGFGTFKAKVYSAKNGRHPKTGKEIYIPENRKPVFIASKYLKISTNNQ